MIRKKLISFSNWVFRNQRIICIVIISLAILRFFQMNYVNWVSGKLCTGQGGIQYAYDSYRLIDGSEKLLNHEPLRRIQTPYLGYISIIAFFNKPYLGLEYVLIIQLLFALLAAFAIFDFCRSITGSRITGVLAAFFILINPFIAQWHLFIHTDSLYTSLLIISCWLIYKAFSLRTIKYIIWACLATIFTLLLRPNGWLIIPATIIIILIFTKIKRIYKICILLLPIIIFIFLLKIPSFVELLDDYRVSSYNKHKVVLFELPGFDYNKTVHEDSFSDNSEKSNCILNKIYLDPITAFKRISAELFPLYRPWLSVKFIVRFLIWMLPGYLFALIGLFYLFRNKGFLFITVVLLLHLFLIGITYAEKEFRFLTFILPLFILLGICGMHDIWGKMYNRFLS